MADDFSSGNKNLGIAFALVGQTEVGQKRAWETSIVISPKTSWASQWHRSLSGVGISRAKPPVGDEGVGHAEPGFLTREVGGNLHRFALRAMPVAMRADEE